MTAIDYATEPAPKAPVNVWQWVSAILLLAFIVALATALYYGHVAGEWEEVAKKWQRMAGH